MHIGKHTGENPFICPECEYYFSVLCSLCFVYMHVFTIGGLFLILNRQACTECVYNALAYNIKKHTGENPFTCSECDYPSYDIHSFDFSESQYYLIGEVCFLCFICIHMRKIGSLFLITNRPVCTECVYYALVYMHIEKHTGETPFTCIECDYPTYIIQSFLYKLTDFKCTLFYCKTAISGLSKSINIKFDQCLLTEKKNTYQDVYVVSSLKCVFLVLATKHIKKHTREKLLSYYKYFYLLNTLKVNINRHIALECAAYICLVANCKFTEEKIHYGAVLVYCVSYILAIIHSEKHTGEKTPNCYGSAYLIITFKVNIYKYNALKCVWCKCLFTCHKLYKTIKNKTKHHRHTEVKSHYIVVFVHFLLGIHYHKNHGDKQQIIKDDGLRLNDICYDCSVGYYLGCFCNTCTSNYHLPFSCLICSDQGCLTTECISRFHCFHTLFYNINIYMHTILIYFISSFHA